MHDTLIGGEGYVHSKKEKVEKTVAGRKAKQQRNSFLVATATRKLGKMATSKMGTAKLQLVNALLRDELEGDAGKFGMSNQHIGKFGMSSRPNVWGVDYNYTHEEHTEEGPGMKEQKLFDAIQYADVEATRELLRLKANINQSYGPNGDSVLLATVKNNDAKLAQELCENKNTPADINERFRENRTLVHFAADFGNTKVLKVLFDEAVRRAKGKIQAVAELVNVVDRRNVSPIFQAAISRRFDTVTLLFHARADVNLPQDDGVTPLLYAVLMRDPEAVRCLLSGDPDNRHFRANVHTVIADMTVMPAKRPIAAPLYFASEGGYSEVVSELLRAAAECNQSASGRAQGFIYFPSEPPIAVAARLGHLEVLRTLLLFSGDAKFTHEASGGRSLFINAVKTHTGSTSGDTVATLLMRGRADVNCSTHDGETPLSIAAARGAQELLSALLTARARIGSTSVSPLQRAIVAGHVAVAATLLEWTYMFC